MWHRSPGPGHNRNGNDTDDGQDLTPWPLGLVRAATHAHQPVRQNGAMTQTQQDVRTQVDLDVAERTVPSNTDGDHERFAHYVGARRGKSAEAMVLEARIQGTAVVALCGKKWVPSRDPQRFPVCPECAELAKGLRGAS